MKIGKLLLSAMLAAGYVVSDLPMAEATPSFKKDLPLPPTNENIVTTTFPDGSSQTVETGGWSVTVPQSQLPENIRQLSLASQQAANAAGTTDPTCYPQGAESHYQWVQYTWHDSFGIRQGHVKDERWWWDDCYQILGTLNGVGMGVASTYDLTTVGQLQWVFQGWTSNGSFAWNKYQTNIAPIPMPHGMHSHKREAYFTSQGEGPGDNKFIEVQLDVYADDGICWYTRSRRRAWNTTDGYGDYILSENHFEEGCQYV